MLSRSEKKKYLEQVGRKYLHLLFVLPFSSNTQKFKPFAWFIFLEKITPAPLNLDILYKLDGMDRIARRQGSSQEFFIGEGQLPQSRRLAPRSPRSGGPGAQRSWRGARVTRAILVIENTNKYVAINLHLFHNFAEIYEN